MKRTSVCTLVILNTFQINGQQAQDTLYLKDGSKAAGKIISKYGKEYRLQSPDGMIFIFDRDSVAKIVPAIVTVTNATLDNLSADELNVYTNKALRIKKAGMFLTITGIGCIAAEIFIFAYAFGNDAAPGIGGLLPVVYGIPAAMIGLPLWTIGAGRMKLLNMDVKDLNLFYNKFTKLKNAGMISTLGGISMMTIGVIINSPSSLGPVVAGTVATFIGIPMWAAGSRMKSVVGLTIQKLDVVPESSMVPGLGITICF